VQPVATLQGNKCFPWWLWAAAQICRAARSVQPIATLQGNKVFSFCGCGRLHRSCSPTEGQPVATLQGKSAFFGGCEAAAQIVQPYGGSTHTVRAATQQNAASQYCDYDAAPEIYVVQIIT